jgi:hypothetical protein
MLWSPLTVEVLPMEKITEPSKYNSVIIGSPVHGFVFVEYVSSWMHLVLPVNATKFGRDSSLNLARATTRDPTFPSLLFKWWSGRRL